MAGAAPRVQIKTSLGTFEVELYTKHCPKTCKNFLELSKKGYYNNTVVSTLSIIWCSQHLLLSCKIDFKVTCFAPF